MYTENIARCAHKMENELQEIRAVEERGETEEAARRAQRETHRVLPLSDRWGDMMSQPETGEPIPPPPPLQRRLAFEEQGQ